MFACRASRLICACWRSRGAKLLKPSLPLSPCRSLPPVPGIPPRGALHRLASGTASLRRQAFATTASAPSLVVLSSLYSRTAAAAGSAASLSASPNASLNISARSLNTASTSPLASREMSPEISTGLPRGGVPLASDLHFSLTADEVQSLTDRIISVSQQVHDEIAALPAADCTWESVFVRLARCENMATGEASRATFMQYVATDKATRDVSQTCAQRLQEFDIEQNMREDLYRAVRAAANNLPATGLSAEDKRLVERVLLQFERNGLALPAEKREQLKAIKKEIADLCIQFSRNKAEDNTFLALTKEELDGMPDDYLAGLTKLDDGRYKVTMSYPDRLPAMRKAKNPETRRKLDEAATRMCPENVGLLEKAVELRAKAAQLLGYENHAAYRLEINMAKDPKAVRSFLEDLRGKLQKLGKADYAKLLELKNKELKEMGLPADGSLHSWDLAYYNTLLIQTEFDVDQDHVKQYYAFGSFTRKALTMYEGIFGVTFTETKDVATWHQDATVYQVHDAESKKYLGTFFLDLFPREGAYKHAAVFPLRPACRLEDGSFQAPVAAMKANFSKPTPGAPSLFKHDELVTFMHELGHICHVILSQTKYARFHGTSVACDFVETPSLMLENWCWEPEVLTELSSHYKTGEPIPGDLVKRLIATEHVNDGLMNLRQLFFGIFDMTLHTRPPQSEGAAPVDTTALYNSLRKDISLLAAPADSFGQATFDHIMGGYDSQYYSYMWSKVFSADMFTRFKAEGIFNASTGREYRNKVLLPGAAREEMDTIRDFLGREPNSDAFFKSIGL